MSAISTTDARGLFTKMLIDVYKERVTPMSFLRSFFAVKESATKELSIEVQRGTEKIAVDVERGTEGNRNNFSKSSEKIFVPPYYREFFDATQLSLYDRLFGATEIDSGVMSAFLEQVSEKLGMLQDKIERAYEKQCADVLETGIVSLSAGINIDFKRKANSLVDKGAGNYWTTSTVNPYTDIEAAGNFLRKTGKSQGGTLNLIFGSTAWQDFLANDIVVERADVRNFSLDAIATPQRNSVGASLHGMVTAGSFRANLWTYNEYYDNSNGDTVPFLNDKKVIILPESPRFNLGFAGVPQLLSNGSAVRKGAFIVDEYIDERNTTHIVDIKSAGVAIPVAVDQVYTLKVVS